MEGLNIRHFKLMNGEEIIGLVAVTNDDNYIVERPVKLHPSVLGGMQFSSWFPFSEAKQFKVLKSNIIQHVSIAESIKETYVQFALKMDRPVEAVQTKTDQEILEEYENRLVNDYAEDGIPELDKKRTIH
jgi:glutamine phosphoribosylpyrophosphate amidotransferase